MKHTAKQGSDKTLADMYRALDRQHPVTITYVKADDTTTVRTIETYDIVTTKAGHITLKAMDRETGERRTFRLDRIVSYTIHRTTYVVALPETEEPVRPVAPSTPAALVAFEIGRDERPTTTRYQPAA